MGDFKPLMPFASTTVIEHILSTIREAGVDTIRVVVGWKAERLIPVLDRCGVPWVVNEGFAEGMYSSVQTGLRSLPAETAAFFLLPGDMPRVQSATLARLIAEWDRQPSGILYPHYEGRRGHPPLIAGSYIPEILGERPRGGLRELLARHVRDAHEVESADPGILVDLDTPDDYRASLHGDPSA